MTNPIFAKVGGLNVISQVTVIRMGPPGGGGGGGGTPSAHASSHLTGGTDAIPTASTTANGLMPSTAVTKLAGVATGATANATDAALRDRATHTGTQTVATLSDFTEAVQDAVAGLLGAGSNVTLTYNDASNTLTVSAASAGTGLDAEAVRDAIGVALVGVGNIAVTVNDAADTITISTTATANSTDAQLRDRATHTGTQAASTISDFTEAAQDAASGLFTTGVHSGLTATYDDNNGRINLTVTAQTVTATYASQTLTVGTAQASLTVPTGANRGRVTVTANSARIGLNTATGAPVYAVGEGVEDIQDAQLTALRLIREGGVDASVFAEYWRVG